MGFRVCFSLFGLLYQISLTVCLKLGKCKIWWGKLMKSFLCSVKEELFMTLVKDSKEDFIEEALLQWGFCSRG